MDRRSAHKRADEVFSSYDWPTDNHWTARELHLLQVDFVEIHDLIDVPIPEDLDDRLEEIEEDLRGEVEQLRSIEIPHARRQADLGPVDTVSQINSYMAAYNLRGHVAPGEKYRASEHSESSSKRERDTEIETYASPRKHKKPRAIAKIGAPASELPAQELRIATSSTPARHKNVLRSILKVTGQPSRTSLERFLPDKRFARRLFESLLQYGGFRDTLRFSSEAMQHHIYFQRSWLQPGARGPETRIDASVKISPKVEIPLVYEERYHMPLISVSIKDEACHSFVSSIVQEATAEFAAMLSIFQNRLRAFASGCGHARSYDIYLVAIHGPIGYISHIDVPLKYAAGIRCENLEDNRITVNRTPSYRLVHPADLHKFLALVYRLLHQLDYQIRFEERDI